MLKKFKDCKLKGLILGAIRSGSTDAKKIFTTIGYTGQLDSLYTELHFLRNYGYISSHKEGRISKYILTKKGQIHALNPNLFKTKKHERINKNINDGIKAGVTSAFENDENFMKAVKGYMNDLHLERPIVEQINKPSEIIGGEGKAIEFIDNPVSDPKIKEILREAGLPLSVTKSQNYLELIKNLIHDYEDRLTIRDRFNNELMNEMNKLRTGEGIKLQQQQYKNEPLKNAQVKTVIEYRDRYIDMHTGEPVSIEVAQAKLMKQKQKEVVSSNTQEQRRKLADYYIKGNYLLDSEFFIKWGNMYPYWIKHFGLFKLGSIEILSNSNAEIQRDHTKGKLESSEILKAQIIIKGRDTKGRGIWIRGYGMKENCLMKW